SPERRAARPAQRHRGRRRPCLPSRPRRAGGVPGDRASGEVPGCGGKGDRHPSGITGAARRPDDQARARRGAAQRPAHGAEPYSRAARFREGGMSETMNRTDSVRVTTLANGLTVATDAMPAVETVSLGVWAGVGARNETLEVNGVAHLLEHMAFKGTRRRSARDIAEE